MKSQGVAILLASLGITKTHSRPHVSNDNPYSEAQFTTLKCCPGFPHRFRGHQDALGFCHAFFDYHNLELRHPGFGLMTPYGMHHELAPKIIAARQDTLLAACARHPEHFVRRKPRPPVLPDSAWINPPAGDDNDAPRCPTIYERRPRRCLGTPRSDARHFDALELEPIEDAQ